MTQQASFQADKKFVDRAHFPYGFARSGEFTKKQALLIEQYGNAYKQLSSGERAPCNEEEQAFVDCCQLQQTPTTEHEKVWQLYLRLSGTKHHYISMGRDDRANSSAMEDSEVLETEDA